PGRTAADCVQGLVLGDAVDPGGWVLGDAADAPRLQRVQERGLDDVLDQLEVSPAEEPGQHGHQPPRLVAEEVLHGGGDGLWCCRGHGSVTASVGRRAPPYRLAARPASGRTSTLPPWIRPGQPLASSAAASRLSALTTE